jgi:hypothetical protein
MSFFKQVGRAVINQSSASKCCSWRNYVGYQTLAGNEGCTEVGTGRFSPSLTKQDRLSRESENRAPRRFSPGLPEAGAIHVFGINAGLRVRSETLNGQRVAARCLPWRRVSRLRIRRCVPRMRISHRHRVIHPKMRSTTQHPVRALPSRLVESRRWDSQLGYFARDQNQTLNDHDGAGARRDARTCAPS